MPRPRDLNVDPVILASTLCGYALAEKTRNLIAVNDVDYIRKHGGHCVASYSQWRQSDDGKFKSELTNVIINANDDGWFMAAHMSPSDFAKCPQEVDLSRLNYALARALRDAHNEAFLSLGPIALLPDLDPLDAQMSALAIN